MNSLYKVFNRRHTLTILGFVALGITQVPASPPKQSAATDTRPAQPGPDPSLEQMHAHLLKANDSARTAMKDGHHPFGAVLDAADNMTILMEQGNISSVEHVESTLARRAAKKYSAEELWKMTLYSTAEPCVMCAGTQYWANIGLLVYGMSERQLLDLTGNNAQNPTLDIPARYVFSKSQKAIKVWGPIDSVVDDIASLNIGFWKQTLFAACLYWRYV